MSGPNLSTRHGPLYAAIHVFLLCLMPQKEKHMDGLDKPGHDDSNDNDSRFVAARQPNTA